MLYLRPFTISGIAIILLQLYTATYLLGYLFGLTNEMYSHRRHIDRAFAGIWIHSALLVFHQNLLAVSTNKWVDMTQYLQHFEVMILYYVCARFLYQLTAKQKIAQVIAWRFYQNWFRLLLLIEFIYTLNRLISGWEQNVFAPRPLPLQFPLFLAMVYVPFVSIRLAIAADNLTTAPILVAMRQITLAPQSTLARFLRDATLTLIFGFFALVLFLSVTTLSLPTWLINQSDTVSILVSLTVIFSYLRYQPGTTNLKLRTTSIGLGLFLVSSSTLGWLIAAVFLRQTLPTVALSTIIGSIIDPNFVVDPAHEAVLIHLHQLLVPLAWFQIIGSGLFIVGYRIYYRYYIAKAFEAILVGIEHLERGEMGYQIGEDWGDEFGRIAHTFNQMAQTVTHHQLTLEQTVTMRTDQLTQEIEQRKEIELRAAVQDERSRIARETHDSILQSLFSLRMRLRSQRLFRANPQVLQAELEELAQDVLFCTKELRGIIQVNSTIQHNKPTDTLHAIVRRSNKAWRTQATVDIAANLDHLTTLQQTTVQRVMQEALSNAVRHSDATQVSIDIYLTPIDNQLVCKICDNGKGFSATAITHSAGHGLKNMQERAKTLGGTLMIRKTDSADPPASGTCIELRLPLKVQTRE